MRFQNLIFITDISLRLSTISLFKNGVTDLILTSTHRAEITVMQFTGHSLPVHQSMTVPRDFTLSHFVSKATHANGICTSAVFGMACLAISEVNILHYKCA